MKCPSCSAEIADAAKFCPECGEKMEVEAPPVIVPGFHPKPGGPSRLSLSGPVSLSANRQSGRASVSYTKLRNDGDAPTGPLEYRLWFANAPYDGAGDVDGVEMGRSIETRSLPGAEHLEDVSFEFPITGNPVTGDYAVVLTIHEYNEDGTAPVVAWTNFEKENTWVHIPAWHVLSDKDGNRQLGEHVEIAFKGGLEWSEEGASGFRVSAGLSNESQWDSGALALSLVFRNEQSGEAVVAAASQIVRDTLPKHATATLSGTVLPKTGARLARGRWKTELVVAERNREGSYDPVGTFAFPDVFEWNGKTLECV